LQLHLVDLLYRNRVNTHLVDGLTLVEAEQRFADFQEIAEANLQSARQDMVSQQQASGFRCV
jgi:hypothetical protein